MSVMKVTIHVAGKTFSKLIERAHAGEMVVITRGDVPVAQLVPIAPRAPDANQGRCEGS